VYKRQLPKGKIIFHKAVDDIEIIIVSRSMLDSQDKRITINQSINYEMIVIDPMGKDDPDGTRELYGKILDEFALDPVAK
jgi:hypothetical protein